MQENKTNYLFVKRKKVSVSREIYLGYVVPEQTRQKQENRDKEKFTVCSYEGLSEAGFELTDETQNIEESLIAEEERAEELSSLQAAIAKLSVRDRQVIQMIYFENKTQKEAAEILGIAKSTMSELLQRILERLKNFL